MRLPFYVEGGVLLLFITISILSKFALGTLLKIWYGVLGVIVFGVLLCVLKGCAFSTATAIGIGLAVGVGLYLQAWTEDVAYVFGVSIMVGIVELVIVGTSDTLLYSALLGTTAFATTFLSTYFLPLAGEGRSLTKTKVSIFWLSVVVPTWEEAVVWLKGTAPFRQRPAQN